MKIISINFVLLFIIAFSLIGGGILDVNAETVPNWVKNTAGWWATDAISEEEFVNAIEFLIKEKVILVPVTSLTETNAETVPNWVKNTAGWWATDAISEEEFVNAIEFLIKIGIIFINTQTDNFLNPNSWDTFDFGEYGIGNNPEGYRGFASDGQYIYFAPYFNGDGRHGEVLRYDTYKDFSSPSSWVTFDASANGIGNNAKGYQGTVFDGQYIYFVPYHNGVDYHGEVLRYDTSKDFSSASSWVTFDASANGIGNNAKGYEDAIFDGEFIYFVPYRHQDMQGNHGEVLRYDTSKDFSSPSSWATFDAVANGVGNNPRGYVGATFDGEFIYFAPLHNGLSDHGEVLRYDTSKDFSSPSSWATFDASANGIVDSGKGYEGTVFDGQYVYFVPTGTGAPHGEVLRYDTYKDFSSPSSWVTFDAFANGVGNKPIGYVGATFDGEYIYFSPHHNGVDYHGEVLRYDTSKDFSSPSSWATFDASTNGVGNNAKGYWGLGIVNEFIYFAPYHNSIDFSSEVLRYDTSKDFSSSSSWNAFDVKNAVNHDPDGYAYPSFDGQYVYFSPWNNGSGPHGEVLRYDTSKDFSSPSSWVTFDAVANIGTNTKGYQGTVFDGQYVYFVPATDKGGSVPATDIDILRYDTYKDFSSPSSWSTFNAHANGVGNYPVGFMGGVFDEQYVYFVPFHNGVDYHGEVLRYDTSKDFSSPSSWATFDASTNGVGNKPIGYVGATFDGQYVYFVPHRDGSGPHGEVLRYDTSKDFSSSSSWATFDAFANGVGNNPIGFMVATFDGQYVYFSPWSNWSGPHGEVLRYDTSKDFSSPSSWATFDAVANGVGNNPVGYSGGVFDGEFIYFIPLARVDSDLNAHGEVLRYNTSKDFSSPSSWVTFDASANGVGNYPVGFQGGVFDGEFIYFAPVIGKGIDEKRFHGEVLRYDTRLIP